MECPPPTSIRLDRLCRKPGKPYNRARGNATPCETVCCDVGGGIPVTMVWLVLLLVLTLLFGIGGVVKGFLWAMLIALVLVVATALVATRVLRR